MSKLDLNNIESLANTTSAKAALNENFDRIEDAFDNTLSRDGSTPNQMEADIDLNDNDLLNVASIDAAFYLRNGIPLEQSVAYADKRYQFYSGTGAQTSFILDQDPGSVGNLEVSVKYASETGHELLKPGIDFNYVGTSLNFVVAPPAGTNNIMVRYDVALPLGTVGIDSIAYTPPSTTIPGTLREFLDSLWDGAIGFGAGLIRYIRSAIGAVPRTVEEKLNEISIEARDFGALADYDEVTDTGTDNTAAFAAAIAHLVTLGGGTLELSEGEYLGHIEIRHPFIKIRGKGTWTTTLRNFGNSAAFTITSIDRDVSDCGLEGVTIRNRDKAVYTSADGIVVAGPSPIRGTDFLTFRDVYIFQMRHGVNMNGRSIWNLWEEVRVAESIQHGWNISGDDNLAQQSFMQCRSAVNGGHGIFLAHTFATFPTTNWCFRSCTIERNLLNGVRLTGSAAGIQAWSFENCYFEENTDMIPAGGGGGLVKAHVFCDTPSVFGLSFRDCTLFGESPGDPPMDYMIFVNTTGGGTHYGEIRNCRMGVSTINNIHWPKGLTLGKNLYTGLNNVDPAQGSFIEDSYTDPAEPFTPAITFGGAAVGLTYNNRTAYVVRHGNLMHFKIYIALTSKGSSVGAMKVTGLPLPAVNTANMFQAVTVAADGFNTLNSVTAFIRPNTTEIELYNFTGTAAAITDTDAGNFSTLMISGTLIVR